LSSFSLSPLVTKPVKSRPSDITLDTDDLRQDSIPNKLDQDRIDQLRSLIMGNMPGIMDCMKLDPWDCLANPSTEVKGYVFVLYTPD
jgi:hypothetical protein